MPRAKRNKFSGVDDVYLTKKSIVTNKVSTWYDKNGRPHLTEKKRYYPRTRKNIRQAKDTFGWIWSKQSKRYI